ncbi:MlaD family protein [Nocardia vermiculata]|uniref:Mammalian cell entry protein n=1 Tax=Nocardia vermiculata TaxID=257274 RepID=A0A846Y022_9NOCA|nr:hypothetical protein [Nocardia vermiculata]NKY51425.1 hypothetical protein [Nocardia vermiculata]
MPAYALPGTEVGPRRARLLGIGALVLAVLIVGVWQMLPEQRPDDEIRVTLMTTRIGAGVGPGTDVRLDGVRVGRVDTVAAAGPGQQRIGVELLRSQLFGLTDALTLDYAPDNLFGITALQLNSGTGGTALDDGSIVDLSDRDDVRDATLTAILESTGQLTGDVLTPKLTQLLRTVSHDVRAFTPLMQAIGTTVRSYTETRQLPPSYLLSQFGSALDGVPAFLTGAAVLLESDLNNQKLQTPEDIALFTNMFGKVQTDLLPTATRTLYTAARHFGGFMPIASAILDQVTASAGTTPRSHDELRELLTRLGAAFHDSPSGPVLNAQLDLAMVPGLAAPLSALLNQQPGPGGR